MIIDSEVINARLGNCALRLRALAGFAACSGAPSHRLSKAQEYASNDSLHQGFAAGEMGFNINLRNPERGPCPFWSWLFSNFGHALALPATAAAVLGTSALYGHQLDGRQ